MEFSSDVIYADVYNCKYATFVGPTLPAVTPGKAYFEHVINLNDASKTFNYLIESQFTPNTAQCPLPVVDVVPIATGT